MRHLLVVLMLLLGIPALADITTCTPSSDVVRRRDSNIRNVSINNDTKRVSVQWTNNNTTVYLGATIDNQRGGKERILAANTNGSALLLERNVRSGRMFGPVSQLTIKTSRHVVVKASLSCINR